MAQPEDNQKRMMGRAKPAPSSVFGINQSKWGLGPRLAGAFGLVAVITLLAGVVSWLALGRAFAAAEVLDQSAEMIDAVQAVRVALTALPEAPTAHLLAQDPAAPARFEAAVAEARQRLAGYAAQHALHRHTAEHAASAHELIAATAADLDLLEMQGQALLAAPPGSESAAALLAMQAQLAETSGGLEALLANAQEDIAAARAGYEAARGTAQAGLALSALLAFGLAAGLAAYSTRRLTRPLAALGAAAERIGAGDLATPVQVNAPGELGRLAAGFEQMRRLLVHEREQARRLAILEERDRIGREMHDGLAQVLGFVNTKAQAVREFLRAGQENTAAFHVDELIGAAREAYTEARQAIADLRTEGVAERPLAELVAESLARLERQAGPATRLEVEPGWDEAAVSASMRVQLLRIVQEALSNARRHARARTVSVSLAQSEGLVRVQVADDGVGFHLSHLLSPQFSHFGLRTMRERAQAMGGTFRIESLPGEGTRLIVSVPAESEPPGPAAGAGPGEGP